jgi:hypothetical protein
MCEALVQFLAKELNGTAEKITEPTVPNEKSVEEKQSADLSYRMSKKPLFRTHVQNTDRLPLNSDLVTKSRPVDPSKVAHNEGEEDVPKKNKDWEDMTVVWKSNVGLTKGARPRRMMTEEERTDYRMRRVRGACVSCKRKKRKCTHDPQLSPSTSTETIGVPREANECIQPQITEQKPVPSVQKQQRASVRFADDIPQKQAPTDKKRRSENSSSHGRPTHILSNSAVIPLGTLPNQTSASRKAFNNSGRDEQLTLPQPHPEASLYQCANMAWDSSEYCWDLSTSELQMLDKQYHPELIGFDSFPIDIGVSGTVNADNMAPYTWDVGLADRVCYGTSLLPEEHQPLISMHNKSEHDMSYNHYNNLGEFPNEQYMPPLCQVPPLHEVKAMHPQLRYDDISVPTLGEPENHWARSQGQQHVEQWLEQKAIDEQNTPRDPELNPPEDEEPPGISPRRRRVKFDFSSLIDGPPTLSTPPVEVQQDEGFVVARKQEQPASRPPRSTSRHSTASRMSFSDIISLSSALTSLSMKGSESRRGSISSDSERHMGDGSGNEDDSSDNANQDEDKIKDDNGKEQGSDDSDESDVWVQWADDEKKRAHTSENELFEKYIRVGMQRSE